MLSRTDVYRIKARACEASAARARDPEVKKQFEELARQWQEMAKQVERLSWEGPP